MKTHETLKYLTGLNTHKGNGEQEFSRPVQKKEFNRAPEARGMLTDSMHPEIDRVAIRKFVQIKGNLVQMEKEGFGCKPKKSIKKKNIQRSVSTANWSKSTTRGLERPWKLS